jgi:glycosyltransferase involved in cell wall biosynthesis
MRVLIDTSHASRGPTGSGVYVRELLAALRQLEGMEVVEARQRLRLRPGRAGGPLAPVRTAANLALDALWLHGGLPRAARVARADVVHHPVPAHSRRIAVPQVATVHDVAFLSIPGRYGRAWRLYARRAYRRAVRRCAAVVCPSQATAIEVMGLLRGHPAKLVVAHHGPGQSSAGGPERDAEQAGPLLFVGDGEARKNLDGLLVAYAAYRADTAEPVPLVLAGPGAAVANGQPGVEGRPALPAADLDELYRVARALVHPSLHEGFGLTPLEAMARGVPVLAVRNAGTQEVCGDAALLVEPGELTDGLKRIASDGGLRADLVDRGRARARAFSWADSARDHRSAYTLARGRASSEPGAGTS